jgi:hypothetical protein
LTDEPSAGALLTLWSVRFACALYVLALASWLLGRGRLARAEWTLGLFFYTVHMLAAFSAYHHWSHAEAYLDTARQTAEIFYIDWGGGIYFNYLFSVVWLADVAWMWLNEAAYNRRPRWIGITIHSFLAFMFFNATIVFAAGWIRRFGLAACLALLLLWRHRARAIACKQ